MVRLQKYTFDRRALLIGAAAIGIAGSRSLAVAQTPATGFPEFPELVPLPETGERADGAIRVVTTTGIIADLVRQVGGARVEVNSILPANADPHSFEPAPDDIAIVDASQVVFIHGLELDTWVDTIIENAGGDFALVTVTNGVPTRNAEEDTSEEEGDDDHEHDHDVDPHVWFDPTLTALMAANIAAALTEVDPDGADAYASRLEAYQGQLNDLDQQIMDRVSLIPEERRVIVTNHDSLGYYAHRYSIEVVGTVIPGLSGDAEPSAKEIAELLDIVAEHNVNAIFAETTISPSLAEELAAQSGIQVVATLFTDSLGDADSGADTYIGMMRFDTRAIVEALMGS